MHPRRVIPKTLKTVLTASLCDAPRINEYLCRKVALDYVADLSVPLLDLFRLRKIIFSCHILFSPDNLHNTSIGHKKMPDKPFSDELH